MADKVSPCLYAIIQGLHHKVAKIINIKKPNQYKETKSVRLICGNSQSLMKVSQGKANRGNVHDKCKEPKIVLYHFMYSHCSFCFSKIVSHYSGLSSDVKTQSEDIKWQGGGCNKVAFDFEDSIS